MPRHQLRRLLLITTATLYSGAALWLAFVLMRHAQVPLPQAAVRPQRASSHPGTSQSARQALPDNPSTIQTPNREPRISTDSEAATPTTGMATSEELEDLRSRELVLPVEGVQPADLQDTFNDRRGGHVHEAIDILAPRGTPVLAVEDGRIARFFFSQAGGTTIYQFDPREKFVYYYAHLDRYAEGLREDSRVVRGQVIGYVGTSGNAPAGTPHLHFAIARLGAEKRWWEGTPLNPFLVWR